MADFDQKSIPILLIDDDKLILAALEKMLTREGYTTLPAKNGLEAIEILKNTQVALIICDQRMPGLKGIDVLKQALLIQPEAIRIVLTAHGELESVLEAINIGQISQFILKPWDDASVIQTVSSSMDKYRLIKENQELNKLTFAQHKSLSRTHEILQRDLRLGARIHETLLLGRIPTNVPGFVIESASIPSHEIDGDFFEFYHPLPHILDVLIGDVMGKGIPAALVGTALKTQFIRFAIPFNSTLTIQKQNFWEEDLLKPQEILSNVHREIVESLIQLEYFVSLFYGRFNLKNQTFTFVDCGFTKPIHYKAKEKRAVFLSGDNFPLGTVSENKYQSIQTPYSTGDFFIFYSDGVSETMSPYREQFGWERLFRLAEENSNAEPQTLINLIKASLNSFAEKETFVDDITILVVKILEAAPFLPLAQNSAKFKNDLSQLIEVRQFIKRFCLQAPGDAEQLAIQLQLAINELFCNIVQHGSKDQNQGIIIIKVELEAEGMFIDIADQGAYFDPKQVQEPSFAGDRDEGFGLYLARQVADQITYAPKKSREGWNHLRLFKKYIEEGKKMHFVHTTLDHILIITLEGESLDAGYASEFKEKVINLLASVKIYNVVFDLSQVRFIDSSGLGVFLSLLRFCSQHNGELKLASLNKTVRTMFELVSMHKIFEIYNTTEEAVQSFNS